MKTEGITRRSRSGFSLLEMVIVLGVIAIILGGAVGLMKGIMGSAREDRVFSDFRTIDAALLKYQISCGRFPTSEQGLEALVRKPAISPVPRRWSKIAQEVPLDPWGNGYRYRFPGSRDPTYFEMLSSGPDGIPETDDDFSSQSDFGE